MPDEKRYQNIVRGILIEKCCASIFGGYPSLVSGFSEDIFMMITNHNTKVYGLFRNVEDDIFRLGTEDKEVK